MSESSDRGQRLRARRKRLADRGVLHLVADQDRVQALLTPKSQAADRARAEAQELGRRFGDVLEDGEPERILAELKAALESDQLRALMAASRRTVIDAVVRPFGLGAWVALADRRGGAVLTQRNADLALDEGWVDETADPNRVAAYGDQVAGKGYRHKDYETGLRQIRKERFKDPDVLTDDYTGRPLPRDGRTHLDHVVSAREIHDGGESGGTAFHLNDERRHELAVDPANLAFTNSSLNQSKAERELVDWMSARDRKTGGTKASRFGVDTERAEVVDPEARDLVARTVRAEAIERTAREAMAAGARQAGNMALEQALGLLVVEFTDGCLDEAEDLWAERHVSRSLPEWVAELAARLQRVAARVAARWEDSVSAFRSGALSGFLASLATTLANLFLSTGKRLVRIIREGIHSLMRAVRMLAFPPDDMTRVQAAHAASKLFASALAVTLGIGVEEGVEKAIASIPVLAPFANVLSNIMMGIATGLGTAWLVRQIDRLDLLGVEFQADRARLITQIDTRIEALLATLEGECQPA
jgi:hypothetical protein